MKLKLGSLLMLLGLPSAMAYRMDLRASNEADARAQCRALLGGAAVLSQIAHKSGSAMGKVDTHFFKYVEAVCQDTGLDDLGAAETLSEALASDRNEIAARAVAELKRIKLYNDRILKNGAKALDTSYVYTANDVMSFLADGKAAAIPYVAPRITDVDASVRYKATYTLYMIAYFNDLSGLLPVIPALVRQYADEHAATTFETDSSLGTKINIVRILGRLGDYAPRGLLEQVIRDLDDVLFAAKYAYVSYSGMTSFGEASVRALGNLGRVAAPLVGEALLRNHGGNFLNGDSYLLRAVEEMGADAKPLIPILRRILSEGQSPYPQRVQKTLDKVLAT